MGISIEAGSMTLAVDRFEIYNAQEDYRCRCGRVWTKAEAEGKLQWRKWDDGTPWYFCQDKVPTDGKYPAHAAFRWVSE